uniref:DNA translocase FtsK n=1 Tax=candidate division WOR-3 bacterium TaxID=2052148 RepID=A0A7C4CDE5_UNCW3
MVKNDEKRAGRTSVTVTRILALIVVLFVAVSLGSFAFGLDSPTTNYGGFIGALVARGLFFALGAAAVLVPVFGGAALATAMARNREWRRLGAFGLLVLGLFLAASMLSRLGGFETAGDNFGGWLGALTSGVLLRGAGLGAYALSALLLYWGFVLWFVPPRRQDWLQTAFILLVGLLLDLFLAYFFAGTVLAGLAGMSLNAWLLRLLGPAGCLIVLIGAALVVLAVFTTVRLPELGWLRRGVARLATAVVGFLRRPARPKPQPPQAPEPVTVEPEAEPETEPEEIPEPPADGVEKPRPVRRRRIRFNLSDFQKLFLEQLDQPTDADRVEKDRAESEQEAGVLLDKLKQFGVEGRISEMLSGPMITRFEFEPAPGIKVQRVESLADDISLALSAERVRILAPIPGKSAVGVEVPNKTRRTVFLRDVLTSEAYQRAGSALGFALGSTITGEPYAADLRTMPHILIAGTTGSGKSMCINSMLISLIYRSSPQEVRFLTIDPKQLELPVYNPIPHLLSPTTIDPRRAVEELTRIVSIMDARYGEFANIGVRDIAAYNRWAEEQGQPRKPYIVVVVDELADLMQRAPTEIEERIIRLAQMSRAVGIHLVLATQRPSKDVITGLIKANFPCRAAFQVASKTDSRIILDMNGAESLLGRGDMLFLPPGKGEPIRLHGSFVSDAAAGRVVRLWCRQYLTELLTGLVEEPADAARQLVERDAVDALYDREKAGLKRKQDDLRAVLPEDAVDTLMSRRYHEPLPEEAVVEKTQRAAAEGHSRERDERFADAARLVVRNREASVSLLQRRLDVGYARAGRIIDQLQEAGIIGPYVGSKPRKVLVENEADLARVLAELDQK